MDENQYGQLLFTAKIKSLEFVMNMHRAPDNLSAEEAIRQAGQLSAFILEGIKGPPERPTIVTARSMPGH